MTWLVVSVVLAAVLFILLAGFAPNPAVRRLALRRDRGRPRMTSRTFQRLVRDIISRMGLDIIEEEGDVDDARLLLRHAGPFGVGDSLYVAHVVAAPAGEVVDQTRIVLLTDDVAGEGAARGLLFTPYEIDQSGLTSLDGLDLFDGARVRQLVARYLPGRLRDLDPYAGIGAATPRPA